MSELDEPENDLQEKGLLRAVGDQQHRSRSDERRDNGGGDEIEEKNEEKNNEDKKGEKKETDKDKEAQKHKSRWPIIIAIIVFVLAVIAGGVYWFMTRNQESTDDAYTEGNAVSIAPKVSGYVVENHINDNTVVHAGDLLLKIDPRDYIAARDQSRANLDSALAQLASAENDLEITRVQRRRT
jgi:membrane fusion protein (multidrug efflux system)